MFLKKNAGINEMIMLVEIIFLNEVVIVLRADVSLQYFGYFLL